MIKVNLSAEEKIIIQRICDLQIESFMRLATNDSQIDVEMGLIGVSVSRGDVDLKLTELIQKWESIKEEPNEVFSLEQKPFNNFIDQLYNYDGEMDDMRNHIPPFHHKLFLAQWEYNRRN